MEMEMKTNRKYFAGIYTSTRTLNRGDRVVRAKDRLATKRYLGYRPPQGRIVYVTAEPEGRCATVRWDAGSEQLCLTSDLRKVR